MRFLLWSGILMVGLAFSPTAHGRMGHQESRANQPTATVRIQLVSSDGIDLEGEAEVERFQDDSGGTNLAKRFKHGTAPDIPYGVYKLRVHTSGFWNAEREVRVFQPNVLTIVALEIGMSRSEGGLPTSTVVGKINGSTSSSAKLHLRLAGIYSETVMDSKLETDGTFKFSGVPNGVYILVVTSNADLAGAQKPRVLVSEEVKVPLSAPLTIELKNN
jgi:hypothetical protein